MAISEPDYNKPLQNQYLKGWVRKNNKNFALRFKVGHHPKISTSLIFPEK